MIASGIAGKEENPLWFTGNLSSAVQEGFKITDFKSFLKEEVSSRGKDINILSTVSPIDMKFAWIEPKGAWGKTPKWYREKTGLHSFKDLVNVQTLGSPKKKIPKRQIPLWKIVQEKGKFRMGANKELLQEVWSPFLREDYEKIFKETSVKKSSQIRKGFKKKMVAITKPMRMVWDIPEEEYRKTLEGRPEKVISAAIAARRLLRDKLLKGG